MNNIEIKKEKKIFGVVAVREHGDSLTNMVEPQKSNIPSNISPLSTPITRRRFIGLGILASTSAFLAQFLPPFTKKASANWNLPCHENCGNPTCGVCYDGDYSWWGTYFYCECWAFQFYYTGVCYWTFVKYDWETGMYYVRYCRNGTDCFEGCVDQDPFWCQEEIDGHDCPQP